MLHNFNAVALTQTETHALTGGHRPHPSGTRTNPLSSLTTAQQIQVLQTQQTGLNNMLTLLQGFLPTDGTTAPEGLTKRIAHIQEHLTKIAAKITTLSTPAV